MAWAYLPEYVQVLHIRVEHISKLYNDDTVRLYVRLLSRNQYIMILYHFDSNVIISAPFKSCADKYILLAYNSIMQSLKDRNMLVDLQMLDIEASAGYKCIVQSEWEV